MFNVVKITLPKEFKWQFGRDCSLTEWGEYEPLPSWTGRRTIFWGDKYYMQTYISLRVFSNNMSFFQKRTSRIRPNRWSAYVKFGKYELLLGNGKCSSCVDAMRQVDNCSNLNKLIDEIYKKAYSIQDAICIFKKNGKVWEPFCSNLGINYFDHLMDNLEYGEYAVFNTVFGNKYISQYSKFFGGYSGGSVKDQIIKNLEPWI